MFGKLFGNKQIDEEKVRKELSEKSEKELLIEVVLELRKISTKCDRIAQRIVVYSD